MCVFVGSFSRNVFLDFRFPASLLFCFSLLLCFSAFPCWPVSPLSCIFLLSASLLLGSSTSLIFCFSVFLFLCLSSPLFCFSLLLCFSSFSASLISAFPCFSAYLFSAQASVGKMRQQNRCTLGSSKGQILLRLLEKKYGGILALARTRIVRDGLPGALVERDSLHN